MHVLGVIPARSGSKGIPNKNCAPLLGKPLLSYTCEQARASRTLTRIILSTDDKEIAACGQNCGVEIPFMRPKQFAQDDTPMLDVLRNVLETLEKKESYRPDIIVVLQPTSPLRRTDDIDAAVEKLVQNHSDSVVSVTAVPHQFSPGSILQLEDGCLVPYLNEPQVLRRQDKPVLYARNGPAVLAVRRDVIMERNSLYGTVCHPLMMPAERSVDIDDPDDIWRAEKLLTR